MKKLLICTAVVAAFLEMHAPSQPGNRAAAAAQASRKAPLKIMPLGDSITWGAREPSYGGYRHLLGKLLTDDRYNFVFVGSRQSGKDVIPDPDNEGHPGWRIPQMKDSLDANGWLETYKPDIILLHIGTNDIHEGDTASAPGNLAALLDDILTRLPQTHVIVAQIIPFRRGPDPAHQSYNGAIPGIAASKGPGVSVVDMQNILTRDDYVDGMHPNASGYDKMARAWEQAIREVVSSSASQSGPQEDHASREASSRNEPKGEAQLYKRPLPLKLDNEPAIDRKASTANAPMRPNTTMTHLREHRGKSRSDAAMHLSRNAAKSISCRFLRICEVLTGGDRCLRQTTVGSRRAIGQI